MLVALVLESASVSLAEAAAIAAACTVQGAALAREWGVPRPAMVAVRAGFPVPLGAKRLHLGDAPDVPDALGYHTEEGDVIDGRVFAAPVLAHGGVVLADPADVATVSVASVVSHEFCEMVVDPHVNVWADGPALAQGSCYALEVCDPVEGDAYLAHVPRAGAASPCAVALSSFVLPAWFDPQTPPGARVDLLGRAAGPFRMTAGGYMVVRDAPGTEAEIFGAAMPDWRRAQKLGPHARHRRAARRGAA